MNEEMESLFKNKTWELVKQPHNQKLLGCKWMFNKKQGSSPDQPLKFNARLFAKGFTQQPGVDYTEVYSLVVRHTSIRMLLAIVAENDFELEQLDVKTAFLHRAGRVHLHGTTRGI